MDFFVHKIENNYVSLSFQSKSILYVQTFKTFSSVPIIASQGFTMGNRPLASAAIVTTRPFPLIINGNGRVVTIAQRSPLNKNYLGCIIVTVNHIRYTIYVYMRLVLHTASVRLLLSLKSFGICQLEITIKSGVVVIFCYPPS